jgi:DNA topoisomerase-2
MIYKKRPISSFLCKEFRDFSTYDCVINIPSLVDGFKVSQRKAIYTMQSSRGRKMKVEQFANETAGFTCYHHGAGSMEGVTVGLAQNFTGSNNVNWFTPIGSFGNILSHGAASSRYIQVEPNSNFRQWFRKEDDLILEYEVEDGQTIEPVYFIPTVPTVLFNGQSGIGTGYSCNILAYNPDDIVRNVKEVLSGKPQSPLVPWYRGFKGNIERTVEGQTVFTGCLQRVNSTTVKITALPIGYQIDDINDILNKLVEAGEIKDYDNNSTSSGGWDIDVYATRAWLLDHSDSDLIKKFKLVTRESENITVWTEDKKIKKFKSPEELIEHFVEWRLKKYEQRRLKLLDVHGEELAWANEKIRFIRFYIENSQWFSKSSKKQIEERLAKENFEKIDELLSIRVYNLTGEAIEKLEAEIEAIKKKITALEKTTAKKMYLAEI